jgi:hypothetical protein
MSDTTLPSAAELSGRLYRAVPDVWDRSSDGAERLIQVFTWRLFPRHDLGRIATSLDFDALGGEQT